MAPAENTTCWKMAPSAITAAKGRQAVWLRAWTTSFSLLVSCICWHDCCDTKEYADSKTLEEYGQRQRNCNLEDMDVDSLRRVADALGVPTGEPLAPVLERFRKATQHQPVYQCIFHEDDGSLTESYGLMFE